MNDTVSTLLRTHKFFMSLHHHPGYVVVLETEDNSLTFYRVSVNGGRVTKVYNVKIHGDLNEESFGGLQRWLSVVIKPYL